MAALPEGQEIFTIDEVAAFLKVHRRTVLKLLHRKKLTGFRVGQAWRIRREALEQFMAQEGQQ